MEQINFILGFLIELFSQYSYLISFFGVILGGEPAFVTLAFIYNKSINLMLILFLFGTLGNIVYDIFWFIVPGTRFRKLLIPDFIFKIINKENLEFKSIEKKELFFFILFSKFLFGTRIATLISLGLNKIKFKKFFFYSVLSSIITGFFFILIGWLAGRGFDLLIRVFNNTLKAVSVFVVIVIIFVLIRSYLHKHIKRHVKKRLIGKRLIKNKSIIKRQIKR